MIQKLFSLLGYEKKSNRYKDFEKVLESYKCDYFFLEDGCYFSKHKLQFEGLYFGESFHLFSHVSDEETNQKNFHQYIYDRGVKAVIEETKKGE